MFSFTRKKKDAPAEDSEKHLRDRLTSSRRSLGGGLKAFLGGGRQIDDELLDELETVLITADVGVDTTTKVIEQLRRRVKRKQLRDEAALYGALSDLLYEILKPCEKPLMVMDNQRPFAVLAVGVNGAGKTTTIGKLARRCLDAGFKPILAAGDTFRAAAVEQLQTWGERNNVPVIAQATGADAASVIFDALEAAKARNAEILIADTAGRLHTQGGLMDELAKIKRVMKKVDPAAPHEVLLVIDGSSGQNALAQAKQFHAAVGVTGIAITKLDGTAKGGVVFAIADQLKLPIRFIGVGESVADLRPFEAREFVDALLDRPE